MKRFAILLVVLGVAVVVYLVVRRDIFETREQPGLDRFETEIAKIDVDRVMKIRIAKGEKSEKAKAEEKKADEKKEEGKGDEVKEEEEAKPVVLAKEKDRWVVSSAWDYVANEKNIEDLIDCFRYLKNRGLAGRNPERHEDFEVSGENAVHLTFFDPQDRPMGTVIVGKSTPLDFQSCYLRFEGADEVYKVSPSIRSRGHASPYSVQGKDWLEKDLQKFETDEEVVRAEVTGPEFSYVLEKVEREVPVEDKGNGGSDPGNGGNGEAKAPAEAAPGEAEAPAEEAPEPEAPGEAEAPAEAAPAEAEPKTRKETVWVIRVMKDGNAVDEFTPEESPRSSFVSSLNWMTAYDPVDPNVDLKEYGLDPPSLVVKTTTDLKKKDEGKEAGAEKTRKEYEIRFGARVKDKDGKEKDEYYIKRGEDRRIFTIGKYKFEALSKKPDEFKPKPKEETKEVEAKAPEEEGKAPVEGEPQKSPIGTAPPFIGPREAAEPSGATSPPTDMVTPPGTTVTPGQEVIVPPTPVEARHILIAYEGANQSKVSRPRDEAKKLVEQVLEEVKQDPQGFAELAKKYSDCPSAEEGGALGPITAAFVAGFREAAQALKVDEVSAVVETEFGYHIIQRTK